MMTLKTKKLTTTAIMTALIFVVTMLIAIPVPAIKGAYFNFGDIIIYTCAMLIGSPYAVIAAGVGSMLADVAVGAVLYAPATLIIKALMALIVCVLSKQDKFLRYLIGCVLAALVMAGGYFLYETILYGFAASQLTLIPNLVQAACGVAGAMILYAPMKALRKKLDLRGNL